MLHRVTVTLLVCCYALVLNKSRISLLRGIWTELFASRFANQLLIMFACAAGASERDVADLMQEMEVMKLMGRHINIVNLLGCCTQNGQLQLIQYAQILRYVLDTSFKFSPFCMSVRFIWMTK